MGSSLRAWQDSLINLGSAAGKKQNANSEGETVAFPSCFHVLVATQQALNVCWNRDYLHDCDISLRNREQPIRGRSPWRPL